MPSVTARSLVTRALRLIQVVGEGETPSADQMQDGLESLNDMVSDWATQDLTFPFIEEVEHTLVAMDATYTLGPSGDIDRVRPKDVYRASIINLSNPAQPLELPISVIDVGQNQRIPVKSVTSSLPTCLYVKYSVPLIELRLWPVPTSTQRKLKLYLHSMIAQFANIETVYTVPEGYPRALRYNLAIEMLPEYEMNEVPPIVARGAAESLGNIKRSNIRPEIVIPDVPTGANAGRGWNWYTGEDR